MRRGFGLQVVWRGGEARRYNSNIYFMSDFMRRRTFQVARGKLAPASVSSRENSHTSTRVGAKPSPRSLTLASKDEWAETIASWPAREPDAQRYVPPRTVRDEHCSQLLFLF